MVRSPVQYLCPCLSMCLPPCLYPGHWVILWPEQLIIVPRLLRYFRPRGPVKLSMCMFGGGNRLKMPQVLPLSPTGQLGWLKQDIWAQTNSAERGLGFVVPVTNSWTPTQNWLSFLFVCFSSIRISIEHFWFKGFRGKKSFFKIVIFLAAFIWFGHKRAVSVCENWTRGRAAEQETDSKQTTAFLLHWNKVSWISVKWLCSGVFSVLSFR